MVPTGGHLSSGICRRQERYIVLAVQEKEGGREGERERERERERDPFIS